MARNAFDGWLRPACAGEEESVVRRFAPLIAGFLALTLVGAACTSKKAESASDIQALQLKLDQASAKSPGAVLRSTLDTVFGEHVALIADAAAAQIQGRAADITAASGRLLGQNSTDLATAFGTVYPDAQATFLALWKKHIAFFLDYGAAAAKNDGAGKTKAVDQLNAYAVTFAAFLNGQNSLLPKDAVVSLFKEHATTVTAVIDALAAKDYAKADTALIAAYAHMDMIGKALATAIRTQHPEKLQGVPDSKPADLRAQLDAALQGHSLLLYSMGAAIIQKRTPDASAAVNALSTTNAEDIASIIGTAWGGDSQATFLAAWKKQIPLYESYARAVATKNATAEAKYRDDLATAAAGIGTVIHGLDPELAAGDISDLIELHLLSIKQSIDSLGRNSFGVAYDALLRAILHMDDLAAELADGVAKQFPTKFV
jgi:hypothetical protein